MRDALLDAIWQYQRELALVSLSAALLFAALHHGIFRIIVSKDSEEREEETCSFCTQSVRYPSQVGNTNAINNIPIPTYLNFGFIKV